MEIDGKVMSLNSFPSLKVKSVNKRWVMALWALDVVDIFLRKFQKFTAFDFLPLLFDAYFFFFLNLT